MSRPWVRLLLAAGLLCAAREASAAALGIETPRVEVRLKPGKSKKLSIKLRNNSERPIRVKAYLRDIQVGADGGPQFPPFGSTSWSLATLDVAAPPAEFMIGARGIKVLHLNLDVPKDAAGGKYGAVLLEEEPAPAKKVSGNSFRVVIRIASVIAVTIKGTESPKAAITQFKAVRGNQRVKVHLTVTNQGNLIIRPQGSVRILKEKALLLSAEINPMKTALLPGSIKDYDLDWPDSGLTPGNYPVEAQIDFGGKEIIGAKTALILE